MYTIRNTKDADIISLIEIEKSAAKAFLEDPDLAWIANSSVQTIDDHRKTIINGYSIVAAHESGQFVGFLNAKKQEENLHILEISVSLEFQKLGIGKNLSCT